MRTLDWSTPPKFCPFCGDNEIRDVERAWVAECVQAGALSTDLKEYQCQGECQGRSFWA